MQQGRDCDGSGRGEIHSGNHSRGCVAGETRTAVDGTETTWVQGDKVAVFLYNGSTTQKFGVTADKTGATTTCTGDVPVGSYSLAAAH